MEVRAEVASLIGNTMWFYGYSGSQSIRAIIVCTAYDLNAVTNRRNFVIQNTPSVRIHSLDYILSLGKDLG